MTEDEHLKAVNLKADNPFELLTPLMVRAWNADQEQFRNPVFLQKFLYGLLQNEAYQDGVSIDTMADVLFGEALANRKSVRENMAKHLAFEKPSEVQ